MGRSWSRIPDRNAGTELLQAGRDPGPSPVLPRRRRIHGSTVGRLAVRGTGWAAPCRLAAGEEGPPPYQRLRSPWLHRNALLLFGRGLPGRGDGPGSPSGARAASTGPTGGIVRHAAQFLGRP